MSTPKWSTADIPNLAGKLAVVTGANSGIGLSAARELAAHGASVVLACRDVEKGERAKASIKGEVTVEKLDVSSLDSVRAFAAAMIAKARPIDLLINNAGVLLGGKRKTTVDGFELTFGTNHLGHFALNALLIQLVLKSPAARVVTVASIAHKGARINFDDLNGEQQFSAWKAYQQSKLANLLFGFELDRRLRAAGASAKSIVVHPGISKTAIFSKGPGAVLGPFAGIVDLFIGVIGQSSDRGARPTLYAATHPAVDGGTYIGPDGFLEWRGEPVIVQAEPQAHDTNSASRLWAESERLTGQVFKIGDNGFS